VEQNLVPDAILRVGIRREIDMELVKIKTLSAAQRMAKKQAFIRELKAMPIAVATKEANDQHYEVPDEFYQMVLGPCLKYSCCYYETPETTLGEAEVAMLEMYCERAGLVDGMNLIDLGCGWGSVTLYMAKKYPNSTIRSISNSNSQREYIMSTAARRGLNNVFVFTGDISSFDLPKDEYYGWADRVISIEMFEHMKNYQLLMKKVSNWIKPGGKLFIHIFTSLEVPGHYESGWMTENFFTGGTLPSDDLLLYFQDDLKIENHWRVNGAHYQRTLEDWLKIMDTKKQATLDIMGRTYGAAEAMKRYVYWRLFFIGCAEFFGARNGEEYMVSHYLFVKP
jgi:cyclopropane-fatty-acyl-phospholipid synthase